ncbi:DNA-binding transcriptional LysR family regulator [Rhizobium sp. BK313]|uniref:LysR family transcriptional regulator n=1 Tax=Rhizobium sp. BK313 TaxID=2587081 RepID=UPI00105EE87A|nr:LysR family transcriptional regulator [Rhizobium sp. BK313]MBB3456417.1 DNA-binding transcriptional LysR family regulator [Rhizobium sp. BK313]
MHKSGLIELEAVIAVARRGSFRAAAVELGMSSTALSHAVAGLEARLGVRLFNRTTRSVSLSAAGEQFVATVAPALSDIHGAMEAVNSHRDTPAGLLRINSSAGAARQILTPIVLEYLRRYPDMRVDLVTEGRMIDIIVDGFDAGIRTVDTVPKDMIAVPFGPPLRFAVVGSPGYFEIHPRPSVPQDLVQHRCIRARLPSGALYRWEFERSGDVVTLDVPGSLTLDEPTLILEAAREGAGLAHLSEWSADADIAAGRLLRVLEDWTPSLPGLCLYYPSRRLLPAGLRAFVDLIHEVGRHF